MRGERSLTCGGSIHRVPTRRLLHAGVHVPLDLHGADLRCLDLRSLDLRGADLRGADLRRARMGLSSSWRARLGALAIAASLVAGAVTGLAGQRLIMLHASSSRLERAVALVVSGALLLFACAALWKGTYYAVRRVLVPVCACAFLLMLVGALLGGTGAAGVALLSFSLLMFALIMLATLARAVAHATGLLIVVVVAVVGSLAGGLFHGGIVSLAVAMLALLLSRRTLHGDPELPYMTRWARSLASFGGTSLRDADLRGAQLRGCELFCSDLRGARLDGAVLEDVREVMCALDPDQRSLLARSHR
jgi:uncharacterized protein YjbI with pentapeptide repeats